jgi:CubicO group peptidase (beta-lactamase class C family)
MLNRRLFSFAAAASCLGACSTNPQKPVNTAALTQSLQTICDDPAKPLASIAALAVRDGQVVFEAAVGRRFIAPTGSGLKDQAANASTLYRIASISKLLTTIGVLRMIEAGQLKLDQDVSDVLGWPLRNPNFPSAPITLRMLMSHTSSLRDDLGYFWPNGARIKDALTPGGSLFDKGQAWAQNTSSHAAPGQYFQYANLPWGVIGTVMEAASGERFDALMHRLLFAPLRMAGGFNPAALPQDQLANIATLYRKRTEVNGKEVWNSQGPWVPQVDDYSTAAPVPRATDANYSLASNGALFGPQGNARASAQGLGTVMLMLLNGGKAADGSTFLKPDSVDMMLSRQWAWQSGGASTAQANGDNYGGLMRAWGLGTQHFLDVSEKGAKGEPAGDRLVQHGQYTASGHLGNAWGLTSAMVFNRQARNGMVFLIGGPGFNPDTSDPGQYSSLFGYEERILTALYEHSGLAA